MFGLSFLNSLFIWGLAAAAVPLIIHLIKRNRAVKLPFAAMRFLQLKPNQKVKSQTLKQILLLLMRMAALAILALAFARPYLENVETSSIWSDQPKAAVILIDHSYSMGYDNSLTSAISKAQELLRTFSPGDKVAVMKFSEKTEFVGETENDFSALANLLTQQVSLSNRSTNFTPAIQSAESYLLDIPLETKEVYLISDFQKTGLNNLSPHWNVQPGIRLHFVEIERKQFSNIAVKEVLVSSKNASSKNKDILVRLQNYGNDQRKTSVSLYINERKISQRRMSIPADEEKIVQFKNVRIPKRLVMGQVEAQSGDEQVTQDNQYYFVFENVSKARILAVNGEPNKRDFTRDELFFVERAVNLPQVAKYSLTQITADKVTQFDFSDYQCVILANVKDLGRETLEQLKYYVRGGGGLILALGDQVNPTIFNQLFRDLSPSNITNKAFSSINHDNSVILAEIDYQHPIFRIFADAGQGDPSMAHFYQYYHVETFQAESVIAAFDDGSPAFLEKQFGAGKVLLFTSSFDTEWNNWPVKAIFLPMLYQALQYLAPEKKGQKSYLVGQPINLPYINASQNNRTQLIVQLPSGEKMNLKNPVFENTADPGIYQIQRKKNNRKLAYFAVNVDSKESDLTSVALEDLQNELSQDAEPSLQTASFASAQQSEQQEKNQKLWRLALLGIILLLIGETWLANRTYR